MKKSNEPSGAEADKDLVKKALNGEQRAFTALVSKYQSPVLAYIQQYIKQQTDAEDLCMECFNKAFRNLNSYNSSFAFSTWIFNIAQNSCIDYFRKSRLNIIPLNEGDSPSGKESWSNPVPSPEEDVISGQTVEELICKIDSLEKIYREVAILRFIKDYAYEEIAREMDLPLNTVRTRVKRAKEILSKKWKS
jgi:RNA polymerase sigma-70 factor (ECF subfamily)